MNKTDNKEKRKHLRHLLSPPISHWPLATGAVGPEFTQSFELSEPGGE